MLFAQIERKTHKIRCISGHSGETASDRPIGRGAVSSFLLADQADTMAVLGREGQIDGETNSTLKCKFSEHDDLLLTYVTLFYGLMHQTQTINRNIFGTIFINGHL